MVFKDWRCPFAVAEGVNQRQASSAAIQLACVDFLHLEAGSPDTRCKDMAEVSPPASFCQRDTEEAK
jgi:hypothetical protein